MPSSLIVAALAAAWLVVLVPMVAKRRQEVTRIAESALASRVLHRQRNHRAARTHDQEVPMTGDRLAEPDVAPGERRYRPGRGGYDPEAAALAARARYVFRQRVVFGLLGAAVLTLALGFAYSLFWSVHAVLDTALIGYLAYLRRQVRIEAEVRNRRAARMSGSRGRAMPAEVEYEQQDSYPEQYHDHGHHDYGHHDQGHHDHGHYDQTQHGPAHHGQARYGPPSSEWHQEHHEQMPDEQQPPSRRPAPPRPAHPTAVAVDLDDEDPVFDELDPAFEPRYRRAAGE